MADLPELYLRLGVSLALGLLVGLQREYGREQVAGIRTFALITLLGTICATIGPWMIAAGLLGVAAIVVIAMTLQFRAGHRDLGVTTEIAALAMFGIGAYLGAGELGVAIVIGATIGVLLQFKGPIHAFIRRLADKDIRAIFQFVLITMVILPIVPNQTFGPYDVINPRNVWLMVVLVVAMSLGGYLAYKLMGTRTGTLLGGVIGGLISSTATTVSYAKRARAAPGTRLAIVGVLLIATAVMYGRILIEIAAVVPQHLDVMAPPIAMLMAACFVIAIALWLATRRQSLEMPEPENPAELKPALIFAVLYAMILLLVAWVVDIVGDRGLYLASAFSGVADMDAITLSTGRMAASDSLAPAVAWRAIVIGSISNMIFKTGIAWAMGGRALAICVGAAFAGVAAVGIVLILLW